MRGNQRAGVGRTTAAVTAGSEEGGGEEAEEVEEGVGELSGVEAMMAQIVAITARSPLRGGEGAGEAAMAAAARSDGAEEESTSVGSMSAVGCRLFFGRGMIPSTDRYTPLLTERTVRGRAAA